MTVQSGPEAKEQTTTGERRAFIFEVESLPDGRCLASIRLIGGGPPCAATCETDDRVIVLARSFFAEANEWSVYDLLAQRATESVGRALADGIASLTALEARARGQRENGD